MLSKIPTLDTNLEQILADLRALGWRVAVHNDYQWEGQLHTFWLFTHRNGQWIKGEAQTDLEAIKLAIESLGKYTGPSTK